MVHPNSEQQNEKPDNIYLPFPTHSDTVQHASWSND